MTTYSTTFHSPIGPLTLIASDSALLHIHWPHESRTSATTAPRHPILKAAIQQLTEYFAKKRQTFTLPLAPRGTPFQLQVWRALQNIPYAHTRSYADLARAIKNPTACRAVGRANGQNPLPIFIPCHRVIGADRSLTGFGGGLPAKSALLNLENPSLFPA